jgi:hypothetical protein
MKSVSEENSRISIDLDSAKWFLELFRKDFWEGMERTGRILVFCNWPDGFGNIPPLPPPSWPRLPLKPQKPSPTPPRAGNCEKIGGI